MRRMIASEHASAFDHFKISYRRKLQASPVALWMREVLDSMKENRILISGFCVRVGVIRRMYLLR